MAFRRSSALGLGFAGRDALDVLHPETSDETRESARKAKDALRIGHFEQLLTRHLSLAADSGGRSTPA